MITAEQKKILDFIYTGCKIEREPEKFNWITKQIERFLLLEELNKQTRKFSIYEFCSKNPNRPVMTGVYHDNGLLVATDAQVMVAITGPENNELNGKIVDKKGNIIEGRYPAWRAVVPKIEECTEIEYDNDLIKNFLAVAKVKDKSANTFVVLNLGTGYYSAHILDRFHKFVVAYPDCKVYVREGGCPVMMAVSGDNVCIGMPTVYTGDSDHCKLYKPE